MKKIFYLLFVAVLGMAMVACDDDDPKPRKQGGDEPSNPEQPGGSEQPGNDDDLDVKFTAKEFWCGFYGDFLGIGTGLYLVEINDGPIDDAGYLTGTGNAITLAVNGELPKAGETVTLPVGIYKTNLEVTDNFKIINEDVGFYLSFVEMMYDGETTSYTDFISDGTMKVTNNGNGKYTIACDLDMFYVDADGNQVEDGNMQGTYTGEIFVDDYRTEEEPLYELLEGDVNLGEMTECAGSFYQFTKSELSDYYLSLFAAEYDWEKEEFTKPGYMMAIDLFTEYSEEPDFKMLNADFTAAELDKYEEWTYQPGTVTLSQGEPIWLGTFVDEISEQVDPDTGEKYYGYGKSAMITGGTIKGTSDGETVTFELDLVTETGGKVTGTYTGKPDVEIPTDEDGKVNNEINAVQARKSKNSKLMRPFSRYERMAARKVSKKAARKSPRKLELSASKR